MPKNYELLRYRILTAMMLKFTRLGWRPLVVWLACLIAGILSSPGMAVAETVNLPLTIDYPLMRSLAVATAFTDPGESAVVLDENQGCRQITLSAPNYRAEGSHLQFEVKAQARLNMLNSLRSNQVDHRNHRAGYDSPTIRGYVEEFNARLSPSSRRPVIRKSVRLISQPQENR